MEGLSLCECVECACLFTGCETIRLCVFIWLLGILIGYTGDTRKGSVRFEYGREVDVGVCLGTRL